MNAKSRDIYQCESCGAFNEEGGSCTKAVRHFECSACGHEWDSANSPIFENTCPNCKKKGHVSYVHTGRICGGTLKLYQPPEE